MTRHGKAVREFLLDLGFKPIGAEVEISVTDGQAPKVTIRVETEVLPDKMRRARESWIDALDGKRWERTRSGDPI